MQAILHDAGAGDLGGPYDLVTIFEALRDTNHPVEALRAVRAYASDAGFARVDVLPIEHDCWPFYRLVP